MFCPNCGNELLFEEQKFCVSCGFDIQQISILLNTPKDLEASDLSKSSPDKFRDKARSYPRLVPDPEYYYVKRKKSKRDGPPGPHSKKCLGYSIASCVIAGIALFVGSTVLMIPLMFSSMYSYSSSYTSSFYNLFITGIIILILVHFVGLALGIASRTKRRLADKYELPNTHVRVGSVFSVFGIVFNCIGLVFIIVRSIALFMPIGSPIYPYY